MKVGNSLKLHNRYAKKPYSLLKAKAKNILDLRVLIYKQPDIETQIFWAHFLFCCPIPTTPHGGQS